MITADFITNNATGTTQEDDKVLSFLLGVVLCRSTFLKLQHVYLFSLMDYAQHSPGFLMSIKIVIANVN